MKTSSNNNNIERLRKITFIICVPFYACTYKEKGTKRAEKGYQNRDKFFAEIVSILQADGWTLTTMGETLDCGKNTCPELTKGSEHIYCHPEELTGEVQDEKAFAEMLKGAASFRIVKKEAGDIYVCTDNEEGKQLYRDTCRDCIDEVIRDVVYLQTNIYGGRKGDWIDLASATRIIGERIFIASKSNNDEYNDVTVLREYITEELCRLQDAGRIEVTTNKHGQTVIKWTDERTLAYTTRCKELEAEALAQMPYKVGDIVKSRDGVTGREEQKHTFGQAFDAAYYRGVLSSLTGKKKVFHFGIPADTVRVEVKRECEGYFRISMKRGESSDVEYFREYIDWETILSTDRAARLLADYRADHHRAHQFKLGDLVRVNDERWGQVNGHTGRIVRVVLQNQLVGSYYEVEFVGDLPKFDNGDPMKANNFEPLDIEPVEEVTDTEAEGIKVGDTVRHNKHEEVATVTAIREAFVNGCDGYRYLYTLDFGQSVTGPFGVELNGGEFLREAFTPCAPDGRELLPEPPTEIELAV